MENAVNSLFATRGVVLVPSDLSLADWPERAKAAGLTTIALHADRDLWRVHAFLNTQAGAAFIEQCQKLGLHVEYELHAMRQLLPRDLFRLDPTLFRMNEEGERVPDYNLCVHNQDAIDIVIENVLVAAQMFQPTTGRHFYWGDDGRPWCRCPKCRGYSDSDQALILENHIIAALRQRDPNAQLAHLAYFNTLEPPKDVRPGDGIFLEYAPIRRRFDIPYANQTGPGYQDPLDCLDANLEIFSPSDAQVLEYWLDVSLFTRSQKDRTTTHVRLPWSLDIVKNDLETYAARGIRHITTFAVLLDRTYVSRYGDTPLKEYGSAFQEVAASKH